jgi:hypothetical protein
LSSSKATSSRQASSSVTACSSGHNQIHKGHRVRLDLCVELGLVLLQSLHELLEESWILEHSLPQELKLWVLHKCCKARRIQTTFFAFTFFFIVIVAHQLVRIDALSLHLGKLLHGSRFLSGW